MSAPEPYLEQLRQHVRKKSGVCTVYHKECEGLSAYIYKSTGKQLSSSTLKRFFQLVSSRSKPSGFTLDVLSEFAGFDNFEHFCRHVGQTFHSSPDGGKTADIRSSGKHVTHEFISRLQEEAKCSVGEHCICDDQQRPLLRRSLIMEDMYRFFYQSARPVYPLIAPGGYGKTVLMHLFFCDLRDYKPDDTLVLFASASAIAEIVTSRTGVHDVLKHLAPSLQSRPEALHDLLSDPDFTILLMIDGLDEAGTDQSEVFSYFKGFVQLIKQSCGYPGVKIMFSIRTESWLNCTNYMPEFKPDDRWYLRPGISGSDENSNTIPPLSNTESRKLWNKLNRNLSSSVRTELSNNILDLITVPYQLSLLHRIARKTKMDAVTSQDVFGVYIQHLMYDLPHSIGIRTIFTEFIKACDYGAESSGVSVEELHPAISRHPGAWEELLGREIFKIEEHSGNGVFRSRNVFFSHQKLFETVAALQWYGNGMRTAGDLFELITKLEGKTILVGVMEQVAWAIMRDHRKDLLIALFESSISKADKIMISKSILDLWQTEKHWLEQNIDELAANQAIRWYYFENLVITDDLPGFFGRALQAYKRQSVSVQDLLFSNSMLAVRAFFAMDFREFDAYIKYMDSLSTKENVHLYPLLRYWSYRSLLIWLRGEDPGYCLSKASELIKSGRDESLFNTEHARMVESRDQRMPLYLHNPTLWLMGRKEDIAMHYQYFDETEKEKLLHQSKLDIRMFTMLYFLFYSGVIPESSLKTIDEHRLFNTNRNLSEVRINQCLQLLIMADWHISKKQLQLACKQLGEVTEIASQHRFLIFQKLAEHKMAILQGEEKKQKKLEEEWYSSGFGRIIGMDSAFIQTR